MILRKLSAFAAVLLLVLSPAVVLAQTEDTTNDTLVEETSQTTTVDESTTEGTTTIAERVAARKTALGEKLDAKRESLLLRKCEAAQTKLVSLANRVQLVNAKRMRAYQGFGDKFNGLLSRLEDAGADVTELRAVLSTYSDMTDQLGEEFGQYEMAVSDSAEMNCTGDPTGFEATLREARQLVKGLKDVIADLHDYLRGEVRDAFTKTMNAYNAASDKATTADDSQTDNASDTESDSSGR